MQSIKLKRGDKVITLNLPTNFREITPKYLLDVCNHITISNEYSLVAIIYKEKLSMIVNSSKKSTPMNTSVVPVFVKPGVTDSTFINCLTAGEAIIVPGSDLELGIHVNSVYNVLSINNILSLIMTDESKEVLRNTFKYDTPFFFVEFKLVPNCAIHGALDDIDYSGDKYQFISEEDYVEEEQEEQSPAIEVPIKPNK